MCGTWGFFVLKLGFELDPQALRLAQQALLLAEPRLQHPRPCCLLLLSMTTLRKWYSSFSSAVRSRSCRAGHHRSRSHSDRERQVRRSGRNSYRRRGRLRVLWEITWASFFPSHRSVKTPFLSRNCDCEVFWGNNVWFQTTHALLRREKGGGGRQQDGSVGKGTAAASPMA